MLNICPNAHGKPAWIDLFDPTPEEVSQVERERQLRLPARQHLEEIESSSRLAADGETLYLSMPVVAHEGEPGPTPLGFVFNRDILVTIRYTQLHGFDAAIQGFKKGQQAGSSPEIFAALVEGITDYAADALEHIGAQLNDVSHRVFRNYGRKRLHNVKRTNLGLRAVLIAVGEAGDALSQIRESLLGLQRIVPFVLEKGKAWLEKGIPERLGIVIRDLQSLADFENHLANKAQFLLDAILGFINTEQNDIFKVLTIVSVVGIPPTLIASMYGMNFQYMPELHWHLGYAWGLGLIFLSAILPTVWFKWRGWW